jgi:hypothetical protein
MYSSVPKPRKILGTDVCIPVCSSVNQRTYRAQPMKVRFHTRRPKSPRMPNNAVPHNTSEFRNPVFATAVASTRPPRRISWSPLPGAAQSIRRPAASTCRGHRTGPSPTATWPPRAASAPQGTLASPPAPAGPTSPAT